MEEHPKEYITRDQGAFVSLGALITLNQLWNKIEDKALRDHLLDTHMHLLRWCYKDSNGQLPPACKDLLKTLLHIDVELFK